MTRRQRDVWVRRFHPAVQGEELICFPHAGGSAGHWFPLSASLAPAVEVLAVQYPGRQDRHLEPPIDDLHRLADRISEVLAARPPARTRMFLGHSMGAALAYEVALRLAGEPGGPSGLFVSGCPAPSRPRTEASVMVCGAVDDSALIDRVRALGGTDSRLLADPELLRLVLPALRADHHAAETYTSTPGAVLTCPVVALAGDDDGTATRADVDAWRQHTTGEFELRTFTGGHFFLMEHLDAATELVADRFRRARRSRRAPFDHL
ncbi:thioesterase II family protein [Streptomyces sp. NPDC057052]|uniref:thioesterase II family protein n=1 Tax=Streptomyces sp. NPDC057052 TaxID=3346010 RepID=UPI0036380C59